MSKVLGFLSLAAVALIAAGALGVVGLGPLSQSLTDAGGVGANDGFALDFRSFLAGTVVGVAISSIGRLSWAEFPRRMITWIYANERRIIRCGYAAMFLAVLLFY